MTSDANADANARLAEFGLGFSHPLQLLLNFSLFQYLVTVYFARRREPRVAVLFLTAALGFLTLMPFATANKRRVASLHDISEVCCYLTFLQQITILTRDVNRKLKLRSLSWFMWTAELLILASFAIIGVNVVHVADPRVHMEATVQLLDMVVETVSLWFIVAFRFYFLAMIRGGWRSLWRSHRYEVFFYVLFMTHGYPFVLLEHSTGLDWGSVEGAYNRLTIALCLSSSIRARLVSEASLLINFSLFQYLLTIYYRRRREHRVRLLLLAAATGFLTLMPFAIDDKARVASLHDISEVCCYLTFLQQITILTRDVNRKLKLRSLKLFMWGAEPRVRLLLLVAITGFATLMPFAIEDKKRVHSLHDISEVCSSLTFLQQITILTRDINRKLKLHSLKWWMWLAETLILASIAVIMINVVEIGFPSLHLHIAARADIVIENVSLCFIVAFRFYFLGMIRSGWRTLWRFHRVEVCFYLLFMTHEYPFIMLKHFTGLNWESVQGAYNRLTIPLQLLINFSLFQYLLTVYYGRRREPRVRLLLLTGIIGFATLIPFAIDDKDRVASLHDISEVCSYLTFLQQITILTRDVNRKLKLRSLLVCMGLAEMLTLASIIVIILNILKLRSLLVCMGLAEMLTLASIIVIILNIVEIAFPAADLQAIAYVDKVIEKVSLWFVAVFRFYFLAMFRGGWRGVWSFHRDELFYYLLLVMHEIPFIVLEHYFPTLHFEYVQGAYNRLMIVLSPMSPTVGAEGLAFFNAAVGQPLKLLLNFSLFQYLLTVYFARRREPRVALLLLVAITGFVTLMPFAIEDKRRVASLHDISEVCCFLSFLQQITILTRDVKRKLKLRPIIWSMWIAEVLILAGVGIIVLNVVEIAAPSLEMHVAKKADLILEKIALCFITAFRFFFLAMIRGGWRPLWRSHRFELVSYLLFLTHELPFLALEHYTDLDWQSVQGTYNRVTIALCLSFSIRARFSSEASAQRRTTTNDPGRDSYWPVALAPSKAGTIVPQS
ncbi:hypothetical protein ATCC90586_005607 [Pythium insidiosum]|nr:hypothetical protein ATCC90586_005607 [Pythium insidiosum]